MLNEYKLIKRIGHLSQTHKMPCLSWSLSAFNCEYDDPLCNSICYAKKRRYNIPNVKKAIARNENKWLTDTWVKDFKLFLTEFIDAKFFRWFDSGDIQGHIILFEKICEIADQCPNIKFWLPTRDKEILTAYFEKNNKIKLNILHPNLIIRLSASDIDTNPDYKLAQYLGVLTSSVKIKGYNCKAKQNNNQCGSCRMCWSDKVKEVSYYKH